MQAAARTRGDTKNMDRKKTARIRRKLVRISDAKQLTLGIQQLGNNLTWNIWPREDGKAITSPGHTSWRPSLSLSPIVSDASTVRRPNGGISPDSFLAMAGSVRDAARKEVRWTRGCLLRRWRQPSRARARAGAVEGACWP